MSIIDKILIHKLIGTPFKYGGRDLKGLDCFGLLLLFYQISMKIILPDIKYNIRSVVDNNLLEKYIETYNLFKQIDSKVDKIKGDIVIMKSENKTPHFGIIVDPPYILHTKKKYGVQLDSSLKLQNEIVGYLRYSNGQ